MKKNKTRRANSKIQKKEFIILFVCSGNSCRSPIAKGLMDKIIRDNVGKINMEITTLSAGTIAVKGQLPTEYAQQAAFELGADIQHHLSSPLTKERIKMADLILIMQSKHRTAVLELVPEADKKTFIITDYIGKNKAGIADPIGQSLEKYQETAKLLHSLLQKVYKKIINKL